MARRSRIVTAIFAAFLFLAGCDTVDPGGFMLDPLNVSLEFSANDLAPGSTARIPSSNSVNIQSFVENQGFALSDVISVRISSSPTPELVIRQPVQAGISHISSAELRGLTSGSPGGVLLEGSNFSGSANRGSLSINIADVTTLALSQNGSFSTVLDLERSSEGGDDNYRFNVSFNLSIEVEG